MSEELIGEELTQEQLKADAKMAEAGMGEVYAPMLRAKREREAKHGHRKKKDKRFRVLDALDGSGGPSPNSNSKTSDPWDATTIDYEEMFRIINIMRTYTVHVGGVFVMKPGADLDAMFDQIFQDRARTPQKLLRLYGYMCLRHANGFPSLEGTPLCDLVVKILVRDGLIEAPVYEWSAGDPKTWIQRGSEGRII